MWPEVSGLFWRAVRMAEWALPVECNEPVELTQNRSSAEQLTAAAGGPSWRLASSAQWLNTLPHSFSLYCFFACSGFEMPVLSVLLLPPTACSSSPSPRCQPSPPRVSRWPFCVSFGDYILCSSVCSFTQLERWGFALHRALPNSLHRTDTRRPKRNADRSSSASLFTLHILSSGHMQTH